MECEKIDVSKPVVPIYRIQLTLTVEEGDLLRRLLGATTDGDFEELTGVHLKRDKHNNSFLYNCYVALCKALEENDKL